MYSMIYVRVTDLNDYMFCPRKIYLKRVLGIKEEKGFDAIFGSIIHDIFDEFNQSEQDLIYRIDDDYPFDYIYNLYETKITEIINNTLEKFMDEIHEFKVDPEYIFLKIKKHVYDEVLERAKNVYDALQKYREYGIFLWDKLEPKIYSELELMSDTLKMVGRIDRVEVYSERMIPIEIKSGRPSKSHLLQLHAYALLLQKNYPNFSVDWGVLYYTKLNKKKEVKMSKKIYSWVEELRDKIISLIESEKDPGLCSNPRKCEKCALRHYCNKINT